MVWSPRLSDGLTSVHRGALVGQDDNDQTGCPKMRDRAGEYGVSMFVYGNFIQSRAGNPAP